MRVELFFSKAFRPIGLVVVSAREKKMSAEEEFSDPFLMAKGHSDVTFSWILSIKYGEICRTNRRWLMRVDSPNLPLMDLGVLAQKTSPLSEEC